MTNDPSTEHQAKELLRDYYFKEKLEAEKNGEKSSLPNKPNLLSWDLKDDGTMVVIDGATGRKLSFAPEKPAAKSPAPPSAGKSRKATAAKN